MTARPDFTSRLRAYTPLGDPGRIIPDLGLTIVSGPDGPSLTATISSTLYSSLPDDMEVAVEVWDSRAGAWIEGRDSRFVVNGQDHDERDPSGAITLTGVSLPLWLAGKAALAGVVPYSQGGDVEPVVSSSTVHVSGTTFTWTGHAIGSNDRVRVKNKGKSKGLSTGSIYYARNTTTNTFQLSHTANGAILKFGSATNVSLERVRTRIINMPGHKFLRNQAISVVDANSNNLTDGSQYYVVNPTPTSIQVATKPGGLPIEFSNGDVLTVYRYLDGQRMFTNMSPGEVAGDPFLEARDRGWGQDASGTDQVFHSWTNAADSNSMVWPARVDDPTVTGVSVGFQPGTSLADIIRFLLDNNWAEFASHGRTFDLFVPLTGNDYGTSTWTNVKRLGGVAQQVKVTKDLTDYRTTEIVRGEANIEQTVKVSRSPWGVLEQYVTASGVTSSAAARSYGNADLTKYKVPAIGYTVSEIGPQAEWLPILDYQRGDWVQVQVKGVWTKLRVTQWTLAKDATGLVTVTVLLENKKRALVHKLAKAAHRSNGGRAATSSSTTPHEADKRKAAKPLAVTVSARSKSTSDKSARSTVSASWESITVDGDGNDLVGAGYEVVVRAEGEQYGKVAATTAGTSADLNGYQAGQIIAVSVRAISSTGTPGELSDEVEYVVDYPEELPDPPSTPVVASTLGSITVTWDGNLVDATDGPHTPEDADAFAYVAVQRSTDGATWTTEAQTLAAAGSVTDLGLTIGTTYQYRLVAVSQTGGASDPSPIASGVVVPVDTAQINADFTQQVTTAASNATAAQAAAADAQTQAAAANTAAAAAQTAAGLASTTANGKNAVTYSTSAASGTPGKDGDLWWRVDSTTGAVVGWWVGQGGAWVAQTLAATVIPNLDAGKITTGTLAAARIAAGTITGAMIAGTTITAANIAASTITSAQIAANTITAADIAANTITSGQLSATAIDAMTITGATFRTASTAKTSGGVQIDSSGLHGYNSSGVATFTLTTAGALTVTGANVSGTITATSGTVSGTLTIGSSGKITTTGSGYTTNLAAGYITMSDGVTNTWLMPGGVWATPNGMGSNAAMRVIADSAGNALLSSTSAVKLQADTDVTILAGNNGSGTPGVTTLYGGAGSSASAADFALGNDGNPRIWSNAIMNRLYAGAAGDSNTSGVGSSTALVVVTSAGTLGASNGLLYSMIGYNTSVSGRPAELGTNGKLGYLSSSRRFKNLHAKQRMDDAVLEKWLAVPVHTYHYNFDDDKREKLGLVAEEVHDAGFEHLVLYNWGEGHRGTPEWGRVDGVDYRLMGVYNKMAIHRLYARLTEAEKQISALTRKAAA